MGGGTAGPQVAAEQGELLLSEDRSLSRPENRDARLCREQPRPDSSDIRSDYSPVPRGCAGEATARAAVAVANDQRAFRCVYLYHISVNESLLCFLLFVCIYVKFFCQCPLIWS